MVVRRYNKKGNPYYFNKRTGKRTSHRAWKISLSYRREKPSYRTRKVDGRTIKVRLGKVRKGISYQKVTSLKKQRSKLYTTRAYWKKKLLGLIKAKASQKKINDGKRKLYEITKKIVKLNRKLGIVHVKRPRPKKKRQAKANVLTYTLNHWEGDRELHTALKKNKIKKYIIQGAEFDKKNHLDIILHYDEVIAKFLAEEEYPTVVFIYDNNTKTVTIEIY